MERFSQRESILLGYSPQSSFMNDGSSPSSTPSKNSDIDFHDVFGGPPPRRSSSIHDTRYSFNDVTVKTTVRKSDDENEAWSSLSEKPVFGEESLNRSRTHSDDFYDDIFKGNNLVNSSPRRFSAPGSRPLSPLPHKPESSMVSSLPAQLSLPSKTKVVDSPPTIGSITRTTSLSRFSSQPFHNPQDWRNGNQSMHHVGHLSQEFSVSGEGSSLLDSSDKADTRGNLEQDSKSSGSPTSSSVFQFHFSIYKWASKGVPMVMPLRGRSGSRMQKRTNSEEQPNTSECADNLSVERQSPISTLPSIDITSNDRPLADSRSSELEGNTQGSDLLFDESTPVEVEVEDAILPSVDLSDIFSSRHNTVDVASNASNAISCQKSEDADPHPSLQTASCEDPPNRIPVLVEQVCKPELKPTHSLFFDHDLKQGNDDITKMGDKKESLIKATKKSSEDAGSSRNVKIQNGKRSSLTNTRVNETDVQDSLHKTGENLGRSKVKGKVTDFVKMFSQDLSSKSKDGSDLGSQRFKRKVKVPVQASVSATIMHEELQKPSVEETLPDASIPENEDIKQSEKESFEAKMSTFVPNKIPYVAASSTPSVASCSKANVGDADESFHENFQIEELTQDEKKHSIAGNNNEEIQAIDAKIRQWSRGKEGNIRSLLTTMQHIVWPESGWKTVPLVDIIEGNAVKRSYQKALLCLHPDKLQQKGATPQQKYTAEKVFDILQEAWNHFNSLGPL